jgi:hypothetical protein
MLHNFPTCFYFVINLPWTWRFIVHEQERTMLSLHRNKLNAVSTTSFVLTAFNFFGQFHIFQQGIVWENLLQQFHKCCTSLHTSKLVAFKPLFSRAIVRQDPMQRKAQCGGLSQIKFLQVLPHILGISPTLRYLEPSYRMRWSLSWTFGFIPPPLEG